MVAPDLASMIRPAASKAHRMVAKKKPITTPMTASRANSPTHCGADRRITARSGCRAMTIRLKPTNRLLRTSAGTSSGVMMGSSRKAAAVRVTPTASTSAWSKAPPMRLPNSTPRPPAQGRIMAGNWVNTLSPNA